MRIGERCAFVFYDAVITLVVVTVLVPVELIKIVCGRSCRQWLRERLGKHWESVRESRLHLLIHAVSVGEVHAAGALIQALLAEDPTIAVTLTTGNVEGRRAARLLRRRIPDIQSICYLPWDRRPALRRWLGRIHPDAVIIVETEFWPNLFRAAEELSIPLHIVNGRVHPRDVSRYRVARMLFRPVLASVRWVAVQNEQERAAFLSIGARDDRTHVVGDLKYERAPIVELDEPRETALRRASAAPLVVAGSTHSPEERWLIEALLKLRQTVGDARLILVPRQPHRAQRVRRLAMAFGLSTVFWSDSHLATAPWDVLIVDRIGVLPAIFKWADIAVIGGSLVRHGGHNPMEAAASGRAIVMGPFHENFRESVAGLDRMAAILLLPGTGEARNLLATAILELAQNPQKRVSMGRRAKEFAILRSGVGRAYAVSLLAQIASPPSLDSVVGGDRPIHR